MKEFLFFILLSCQLSSAWALETPALIANKDIPTIKKHARYVLQIDDDAPAHVAIYLYAPNEQDNLCDDIGGFCLTPNDRFITGNYYLITLNDAQFSKGTTISSILGIGKNLV